MKKILLLLLIILSYQFMSAQKDISKEELFIKDSLKIHQDRLPSIEKDSGTLPKAIVKFDEHSEGFVEMEKLQETTNFTNNPKAKKEQIPKSKMVKNILLNFLQTN